MKSDAVKVKKGFACLTPERRREISRKGGLAVWPKDKPRGFARNRQLARDAAIKGALLRKEKQLVTP